MLKAEINSPSNSVKLSPKASPRQKSNIKEVEIIKSNKPQQR